MTKRPTRIVPFDAAHAPAAARMFVAALETLRRRTPALAQELTDPGAIQDRLINMRGVAALDDEQLVGYLTGWFPIQRFRGADRIAAYVPEWGHGAVGGNRRAVYNALYRSIAADWTDAGCTTHAITVLAGDDEAVETWFWSGFGMGTVDAVRPMTPLGTVSPSRYTVRSGTAADAAALARLDAEHVRHYAATPVFMPGPDPFDASRWEAFIQEPPNAVWLIEDAGHPFGFIRFDHAFHGSAVTASPDGVFISGAYVNPAYRGRGAATAMLDAAIRQFAIDGFTFCALDFEAFNPEATAFWMRHFTPVCYSLMRVPETPVAPAP